MEYLSGYAATSNLDLVCVTGNAIVFQLANLQSSLIASTHQYNWRAPRIPAYEPRFLGASVAGPSGVT
jgi:hypothetical protein